jgi:hypothetical protein
MVWIVILVGFVAISAYGAYRLLADVDSFHQVGRGPVLPRGLVYAAAVVVGSQATDAASNIDQVSSHSLGLTSGDKAQAIIQVLSTHLANIAWQAGLLLSIAVLLAARLSGRGGQLSS